MKDLQERRHFLRASLDQFLTETAGGDTRIARVVDISEGGLRYLSPRDSSPAVGSIINLEFTLPGDENTIKAKAVVTGKRKNLSTEETSACFMVIDGRHAGQIRSWVVARKRAEIFEALRRQHLGS
jgi:c-di-GMP-binding flagellar brake protein YcgR